MAAVWFYTNTRLVLSQMILHRPLYRIARHSSTGTGSLLGGRAKLVRICARDQIHPDPAPPDCTSAFYCDPIRQVSFRLITSYNAAPPGRQFVYAVEHINKLYDMSSEDELWDRVNRISNGYSLVKCCKDSSDITEDMDSDITQECNAYIERRVQVTSQARKPNETIRSIVKTMIANQSYGVQNHEIGSAKAATKLTS